jgi:Gpi18-like mannosyltransferase
MKELKQAFAFLKDKYIWILVIFYLALVIGLPRTGYSYDMTTWTYWLNHIKTDGLFNIYNYSDVNYLPPILYLLQLFSSLFKTVSQMDSMLYLLKAFILLFDLGSVYLVLKILRKFNLKDDLILFLLFNIAFFYNTLFWEQVDGVYVFFALLSIYLAVQKHVLPSVLVFVLAVTTKLQAVIFAPLLLLLYLPEFKRHPGLILESLVWAIILETGILLPFIAAGRLPDIIRVVKGSVDFFPYISMNAYNFWVLILGYPNTWWKSDSQLLWNISYKTWGMIMFAVSSVIALVPIGYRSWLELRGKIYKYPYKAFPTVLLTAALLVMNFFYFNTQMHERYLHAAIVLFAAYALLTKRYLIYICVSIAYFLNIEAVLKYLDISHDLIIFRPRLIALVMLLMLLLGFYYLYRDFFGKHKKVVEQTETK